MHNPKILGIDLSNSQISVALLSKTNKSIEVLKSAAAPMPEGVMANGDIKNPTLLAKAVKDLCSSNKIPTDHAVVSLVAKQTILRVMEIPKDLATNPAQYVRDELKNYAATAGKAIIHDYCPLSLQKKTKATRLLLAATNEGKVAELAKAFNRSGIMVKAVEPGALAYIRLLHANAIAKKFGSNVLLVAVGDTATTMCVFRDTNLDFVHTTEICESTLANETDIQNLLTEICALTQFYDVEVADASKRWEIILAFAGEHAQHDHVRQSIQNGLIGTEVRISSPSTLRKDTSLIAKDGIGSISPISAGLAMKYLKAGMADLKINLFPIGSDEIHSIQKYALTTVNIAIAALLLSLLVVPLLRIKLTGVNRTIMEYKQNESPENVKQLLCTAASLDQQSKSLTEKIQAIATMNDSVSTSAEWPKILQDISHRIPQEVRIISLIGKDAAGMTLTGQALSYDQIHRFVKQLETSPFIRSATITASAIDPLTRGTLSYTINCSVINGKGARANAN